LTTAVIVRPGTVGWYFPEDDAYELATANWHKSSHSGNNGCGDSQDPSGSVLLFTHLEWRAFLAGVRDGEFDGG
jgi:Domain of unknown function (DUF397)